MDSLHGLPEKYKNLTNLKNDVLQRIKPGRHSYLDGETSPEKILVACSTNEVKGYSLQRWIDNVKEFTYPNLDYLVVDTSKTDAYIKNFKDQIPTKRIPYYDEKFRRMCESMEAIRLYTLKNGYDRLFCVESDIIPPADITELMLSVGKDADWVSHAFPLRNEDQNVEVEQGIGCTLFSRKLLRGNSWAGGNASPDAYLWNLVRPSHKYKTLEMWGYTSVRHLGS
jgi:hypothetical protein